MLAGISQVAYVLNFLMNAILVFVVPKCLDFAIPLVDVLLVFALLRLVGKVLYVVSVFGCHSSV